MVSFKPLVLIIGSGKNIGASTSQLFASKGWTVAIASRSLLDAKTSEAYTFKFDASKPNEVEGLFERVKKEIGQPPSAVIYNAASFLAIENNSPVTWAVNDLEGSIATNTVSFYAALREASKGFESISEDFPKTVLYTGNGLNSVGPVLPMLTLGLGKVATSYLIEGSAPVLAEKGVNLYYVDERKSDGGFAGGAISGTAHAEFFYELATDKANHPWLATFVPGKGYVDFSKK